MDLLQETSSDEICSWDDLTLSEPLWHFDLLTLCTLGSHGKIKVYSLYCTVLYLPNAMQFSSLPTVLIQVVVQLLRQLWTQQSQKREGERELECSSIYPSDRPTLHPWRWSQDVTTFLHYPYHSESIYVNYFSKTI